MAHREKSKGGLGVGSRESLVQTVLAHVWCAKTLDISVVAFALRSLVSSVASLLFREECPKLCLNVSTLHNIDRSRTLSAFIFFAK